MMETKNYNRSDYALICNWLHKRNIEIWQEDQIPETGFLVYFERNAIAAGFLRRCEGGYVMIDSVITNPDSSSELRHQAYDCLVEKLIQTAKSMGATTLIAYTTDSGTLHRSYRHGFVQIPHVLIVRNLKDNYG